MSSGFCVSVCPGEVFVVAGVMSEAAIEDADEPVRECAEGLVVGGAVGAALNPVLKGTGRLHLVFGLLFAAGLLLS